LLANAVIQSPSLYLTDRVRQQAGSYRECGGPDALCRVPGALVGPASAGKGSDATPLNQCRACISQCHAAELMSFAKFVGAGLLANALSHSPSPYLTDRVRQQAGSYRECGGPDAVCRAPCGTGFSRESVRCHGAKLMSFANSGLQAFSLSARKSRSGSGPDRARKPNESARSRPCGQPGLR
jgi:hypothetical protein